MSVLLLLACGNDPVVEPKRADVISDGVARPDIVLVLVERLREDGTADGAAARFFEALSREGGTRFDAAYAQSPSTMVSFGSLLTGHYPSAIPLCDVGNRLGDRQFGQELPWCATLPEHRPLLPDVLELYGYDSAVFLRGEGASPVFRAGFEHVDSVERAQTDWTALREDVLAWWNEADAPRFLTLVVRDLDLRKRPELLGPIGIGDPEALEYQIPLQIGEPDPLAAVRAPLHAAYVEEAARTGSELRGLLDGLDGARMVVTSTVGMNLGERDGLRNHTLGFLSQDYVVDRSVHVPLWVSGGEAATRSDVVELVDLFATFAAWGHAVPPSDLPGSDLALVDEGGMAFAEYGPMLAVRGGRHLLTLHRPMPDASASDPWVTDVLRDATPSSRRLDPSSDYALHDVVSDPMQQTQLVDASPEIADALHAGLLAWRLGPDAPPKGRLTPEQIWELRMNQAFGYW